MKMKKRIAKTTPTGKVRFLGYLTSTSCSTFVFVDFIDRRADLDDDDAVTGVPRARFRVLDEQEDPEIIARRIQERYKAGSDSAPLYTLEERIIDWANAPDASAAPIWRLHVAVGRIPIHLPPN